LAIENLQKSLHFRIVKFLISFFGELFAIFRPFFFFLKKAADPDLNFLWKLISTNPDASLGGVGGGGVGGPFITKPGTCLSL